MVSSIFHYLFTLEKDYNYFLNKRFKELGLKKTDIKVIKNINKNKGISPNEICTLLKEDKVTVAKSIKKLMELGYVKKSNEHSDKRVASLYLTDDGKEVRSKILEVLNDLEVILMNDFPLKDKEIVIELLAKMSKNIYEKSDRLNRKADK